MIYDSMSYREWRQEGLLFQANKAKPWCLSPRSEPCGDWNSRPPIIEVQLRTRGPPNGVGYSSWLPSTGVVPNTPQVASGDS